MSDAYPSEFRRAVADEAYFRTSDGFENLALRKGVHVELLRKWVDEFHPPGPRPFDVMHCWIGNFAGDQTDFWAYVGDDDGAGSPMCAQFMEPVEIEPGEFLPTEFDYDLLYAELFPARQPVEEILQNSTFSTDEAEIAAISAARSLGVSEANALVCYGDPSIRVPEGAQFGDLIYLGGFPDSKRKETRP